MCLSSPPPSLSSRSLPLSSCVHLIIDPPDCGPLSPFLRMNCTAVNFDLAFKFSIFFFFCFVLFSFANPPPTRSFTQTFNEIFPIHSLSLSIQHRNNHPFYTPHLALPRQCTCLFVACRECEFRLLINLCFHMAILVVVFVCVCFCGSVLITAALVSSSCTDGIGKGVV